jgi:hypothetical protein
MALASTAHAGSDTAKLALVRPGGGFMVADGTSIIPLQVIADLPEGSKILEARVTADGGKVTGQKTYGDNSVIFWYQPPNKQRGFRERFEVTLRFEDGERSETFPVDLTSAVAPSLDLLVEPSVIDVRSRTKPVSVNATASGRDIAGLELTAQPGTLGEVQLSRFDDALRAAAAVGTGSLPDDQPSYILALAATASSRGFAAKTAGVAVEAPIRISVEIPPKTELHVDGASNNPDPVPAPADGRTVMEDVVVRYGAQIRAFSKRGSKKTEVSISVPSLISPGVAMAIPGQNVADGGTGATILVAVPPSPFGDDAPMWPEVQVEGAQLVGEIKVAADIRALILRRPDEPGIVSVLLDEQRVASIELGARHGVDVIIAGTYAKTDERAAFDVMVRDSNGTFTDLPVPRIKTKDGRELKGERTEQGKYRVALATTFPGASGSEIEVVAEIPPPPFVGGEVLSFARASTKVMLGGSGGPVLSNSASTAKIETTIEPSAPDGEKRTRFALGLAAGVGTTFSKLLVAGGGVLAEVRPPVLDNRLAIRTGIEFAHASGSGTLNFEEAAESTVVIAGVYIPVDFGFAVVHTEDFELALRAGLTMRVENGVLRVSGDTVAGSKRFGVSVQATVDAAFNAGPGALVLGATLSGIGASAEGFSSDEKALSGALVGVRAEAGYKLWF